jgi:hypothetical protein
MAKCEVCDNQYDKTFEVLMAGKTHVFDSFECAISALAPTCDDSPRLPRRGLLE